MSAEHDLNVPKIDGRKTEHVVALIEDLEVEFEKRMETIRADFATFKGKVQAAHGNGMLKLPKNLKKMKLSEFNALYKTDLKSILCSVVEAYRNDTVLDSATAQDDSSVVSQSSKKRGQHAMETPLSRATRGRCYATPSTTAG